MTSWLQGKLADQIYKGFKRQGMVLAGSLRREEVTGLDGYGDPIYSVSTYDFEGYVDDFSALTRQGAGIPQGDRRVNIFAKSLSVTPQIGDDVTVEGYGWMKLRTNISIDPAKTLWECQAYEIEDPT